jgi:serine/threonine protein kinase
VSKLKRPVTLETAFGSYMIDELLGQGGAGKVYGGIASDGTPVAIKILTAEQATTDKRRRFRNEIAFLARNKHANIVSVIDHGIAGDEKIKGPFYVMRRYTSSLRKLIDGGIPPEQALQLFSKILDGVEAAHLQGVVHRDLKPENILIGLPSEVAVADFGIASFTDDIVATLVETMPSQRLANFQYAAPEQRVPGRVVDQRADIYALGLMANEMFTSSVPYGTDYEPIGRRHSDLAFLDPVIAKMLRQDPNERYALIAEVKQAILLHRSEFGALQKLNAIEDTVVPAGEITEPLAHNPPRVIAADWMSGILKLTLDRDVDQGWIDALHNIGNYTSVMGIGPRNFQFRGREVTVSVQPNDVQRVIDYFKAWLPSASQLLKYNLEQAQKQREHHEKERLKREKTAEEQRLRILQSIKI